MKGHLIPPVAQEVAVAAKPPVSASADGSGAHSSFDRMLNKITAGAPEQEKVDSEDKKSSDPADNASSAAGMVPINWLLLSSLTPVVMDTDGSGGQGAGENPAGNDSGGVSTISSVAANGANSSSLLSVMSQVQQNVPSGVPNEVLESVIEAAQDFVGKGNNQPGFTKVEDAKADSTSAANLVANNILAAIAKNGGSGSSATEDAAKGESQAEVFEGLADGKKSEPIATGHTDGLVAGQKENGLGKDSTAPSFSGDVDPLSNGAPGATTGKAPTILDTGLSSTYSGANSPTNLSEHGVSDGSGSSIEGNQALSQMDAAVRSVATPVEIEKKAQGVDLGESIVQQIESKVQLLSLPRHREIKISLEPESLGKVSVSIIQDKSGVLTVRMLADNPLSKDLIESHIQELKAAFERQGLKVEGFSVSLGQGTDNFRGDPGFGFSQGSQFSGNRDSGTDSSSLVEEEKVIPATSISFARGAVDLRI